MPWFGGRLKARVEYPVRREYTASPFWHWVGIAIKALLFPALAFWVVWDSLMEKKAFISLTFTEADTYIKQKLHMVDCVPTRSGDRFYTNTGVFEWDYMGDVLYNQSGTHDYKGGDISRCDVAEYYTRIDATKVSDLNLDNRVSSHIYVICNTTEFRGMLHTSTTGWAPRKLDLLDSARFGAGPGGSRDPSAVADANYREAGFVQEYYEAYASDMVSFMSREYTNVTVKPERMRLRPNNLGCWRWNQTTDEDCFDRKYNWSASFNSDTAVTYLSNGSISKVVGIDERLRERVDTYFTVLTGAVRYDLGCPIKKGLLWMPNVTRETKPVFNVYYQCTKMEFRDPAGAIMIFVSTFYGLWMTANAAVDGLFWLFSKKQPEDANKPEGFAEEAAPMLAHNSQHSVDTK